MLLALDPFKTACARLPGQVSAYAESAAGARAGKRLAFPLLISSYPCGAVAGRHPRRTLLCPIRPFCTDSQVISCSAAPRCGTIGLMTSPIEDAAGVTTLESSPFLSGGGRLLSITPASDPMVAQDGPDRQSDPGAAPPPAGGKVASPLTLLVLLTRSTDRRARVSRPGCGCAPTGRARRTGDAIGRDIFEDPRRPRSTQARHTIGIVAAPTAGQTM